MRYGKGWIALIVLAVLTPLGLIAIGSAWGEWDLDGIKERVGFAPEGMRRTHEQQSEAPIPDYELPGFGGCGWRSGVGTILSALIGAGITAGCAIGLLSFSKVLRWLLTHWRPWTMAALCGFMCGSLRKIWPFQHDATPHLEEFKLKQFRNVWPESWDGGTAAILASAAAAMVFVFVIERLTRDRAA